MKRLLVLSNSEYPDWFLRLSTKAQMDYIEKHEGSKAAKLYKRGIKPPAKEKITKQLKLGFKHPKQVKPKIYAPKLPEENKSVEINLQRKLQRVAKKFGGNIIASNLAKKFKKYKTCAIVGHIANKPQDLAVLGSIYRDPTVETFRIFYMKDNKVVGHSAISQRSVNSVAFDNTYIESFIKKN